MKNLNLITISFRNLSHQWLRTTVMMAFCFVLASSLLISGVAIESMRYCVKQTVDRLGADIIVVPHEFSSDYAASLFSGEHCSFYFDSSLLEKASKIRGVAAATPQLFIATLDASCCSAATQLIAFDPKSDFIIQPWLAKTRDAGLETMEAVIGGSFYASPGETIQFFDKKLKVAAKLERTGTNYDNCVFVNFDTARKLLQTPHMREMAIKDRDPDSVISAIMIRVTEGTNPTYTAFALNSAIQSAGVSAFTASAMVSSTADSIASLSAFSSVLNGLLLAMALFSIVCIFTITIIQRKTEFGVMMTIGADKRQLFAIILTEGAVIGLAGGLAGIAAAGGVMWAFYDQILIWTGIPSFIGRASFYAAACLGSLGISLATGLTASLCAIWALCRKGPLEMIQEVNS